MAICTNCGKEFNTIGISCPYCHAKLGMSTITNKKAIDKYKGRYDDKNNRLMILSIFIPLIGYLDYFKNKDEYPLRVSSSILGAFIGTIIYLLIITIIIYFILFN